MNRDHATLAHVKLAVLALEPQVRGHYLDGLIVRIERKSLESQHHRIVGEGKGRCSRRWRGLRPNFALGAGNQCPRDLSKLLKVIRN